VLRRLSTTPMRPSNLLVAQLLITLVATVVATGLLVAVAHLVFGIPLPAHPLGFLVAIAAGTSAVFALGLVIAAVAPRARLRGVLAGEPDMEVVGEAGHGAEALARVAAQPVDVVLMDLRMPTMGGVEAIGAMRRVAPAVRVLVLTTFDTDRDVLPAIEAGATGYLLKDTPREELFRAVRAAAAGQPLLAPAVAASLLRRVRAPVDQPLSAREVEVLGLVARGGSNKEIARFLAVSEATVKTHLIHIFQKLGVADRTAAVTSALERGIIRLEGACGMDQ